MQMVERAPDDRPLVVAPSRSHYTRQFIPWAVLLGPLGAVALFAAAALVGLAGTAVSIALGVAGLGSLALAGLALRGWRAALRNGPALAADTDGLWIRVDGGSRGNGRVAHIAWPEVTGIRVRVWTSNQGHQVPFLCVEAPTAVPVAVAEPAVRRATARAVQTFGTPFVLSDRRVEMSLPAIVAALRPLAGPELMPTDESSRA